MLDKQQSPLGKHATAEKHRGQSPSHVLTLYSLFTNTVTAKPAQSNTGSVTHFTTVLWFPGSLWS